ncbi:hypothetical protein BH24BAC1_BH24BAC1_33860 [soil metagenome]
MFSIAKRSIFLFLLVLGHLLAIKEAWAVAPREYYELRVYNLTSGEQQKMVEDYFQSAAIPAYNRMGIKTVGVFREMEASENPKLFVVIPFSSLQQFEQVNERLAKDAAYQKAAAPYLQALHTNPAYARIESSLLHAFEDMAKLEVPAAKAQNKARIFELRTYESHSEHAGTKKVQMFNNQGGEIKIFRRTGLTPVFFGESIIGGQRPNLTYMLTYPDMEAQKQAWKNFSGDPEWKRVSGLPEYANTVSNITKVFLIPAPFSQI